MTQEDVDEFEEETVYDEEGRADLVDDDKISPEEEGFMRGYEESDDKEDEVDAEDKEEGSE